MISQKILCKTTVLHESTLEHSMGNDQHGLVVKHNISLHIGIHERDVNVFNDSVFPSIKKSVYIFITVEQGRNFTGDHGRHGPSVRPWCPSENRKSVSHCGLGAPLSVCFFSFPGLSLPIKLKGRLPLLKILTKMQKLF